MTTIPFDQFWAWLQVHPNCIVRISTPDAAVYDDDDFHWYVGPAQEDLVAQLLKGKRMIAELLISSAHISYVQDLGEEREGEHVFEAIAENATERFAAYAFVMSHGFAEEEDTPAEHGSPGMVH